MNEAGAARVARKEPIQSGVCLEAGSTKAVPVATTLTPSPADISDRAPVQATTPLAPVLWRRLEELVDRAPDMAALRAHRLELAAARIWKSRGLDVPPELTRRQRETAAMHLSASHVLERVRAAYDGPLMLMKGPEVAARYEHPGDRWFGDLDVLVDDAPAAQRALTAAGFKEIADPRYYDDKQHLCPLIWPGMPVVVELHRRHNRPRWLPQVGSREILELSVPSATGVAGVLAPTPGAHALLLAAHGFAHGPMGQLRDIVDVAAVIAGGDRDEAETIASEWGWRGLWRIFSDAVDALVSGGAVPGSLRVLGNHLVEVRERTVFRNHVARTAAPIYALPRRQIPSAVAAVMLRETIGRAEGESWRYKLHRSRLALGHALMSTSAHEQTLAPSPEPAPTSGPAGR
jgi:hypothetical protein